MEQPNYYAIIPSNVRYDKDLKPNEKLLYGEITALSNKSGICYASNKYFADLYDVANETISRWISHLRDLGYIEVELVYKDGTKEIDKRLIKIIGNLTEKTGKTIELPTDNFDNRTIDENDNTPMTETSRPPHQKHQDPHDKKVKENNTSINNTRINNITTTTNNNINNINSKELDLYNFIENNFGRLLSPLEYEKINEWLSLLSIDLIKYAIEIAVLNNKKTFSYVNGIVRNWITCGYKTKQDVIDADNTKKSENRSKPKNPNVVSTEDLEWLN